MKILLTGASSYVGARLFFDLSRQFDVVGTYHGNKLSPKFIPLDITSSKDITQTISFQKPDIILHVAADANPRTCEANPENAIALNQTSTKNIVSEANAVGAKVIFMSSFGAINPEDVYGETKFHSEEYVKDTKAGWITLRPSLIIGYSPNTINDRPFNRILKNIDEKTEAVYDTSWKFQPTYIGHLSEVIETVIRKNMWNKIIPIVTPDLKSRFDIAHDILSAFHIPVTPIDKHDTMRTITDDLSTLKSLHLPIYSYETMIEKIIDEIHRRNDFSL